MRKAILKDLRQQTVWSWLSQSHQSWLDYLMWRKYFGALSLDARFTLRECLQLLQSTVRKFGGSSCGQRHFCFQCTFEGFHQDRTPSEWISWHSDMTRLSFVRQQGCFRCLDRRFGRFQFRSCSRYRFSCYWNCQCDYCYSSPLH